MKKSIIRIVCFLLLLGTVLYGVNKVFKVKDADGIYSMTKYYELKKNTVDVLFLGSSHAFESFNTGTLWDEFGNSSYILGGSMQPLWNTYYYLKEALKTQTPKVIVLEGYMTKLTDEYADDVRIIKNNYGIRWSSNKIKSLKESVPQERLKEFLLEYEQYHNRYTQLSAADFKKNQNYTLYDDWKGLGLSMVTTPLETIDVSTIEDRQELYEKTEKYYRMIIELAQENNIPIVVVIAPYAGIKEERMKQYNKAADIAEEYGVPFINYNLYLDEIGIDFSTDAADDAHLNYKGNRKFTSYFGNWLNSNYDIEDHRNDVKYESWQKNADYIREMIYDEILLETNKINDIAPILSNPSYWVVISIDGYCDVDNELINSFLLNMGIPADGSNGIWLRENNGVIWVSGSLEARQYLKSQSHDFGLIRYENDNGDYVNEIIVDREKMKILEEGINVYVFDTVTECSVDLFGIDNNGNVIR